MTSHSLMARASRTLPIWAILVALPACSSAQDTAVPPARIIQEASQDLTNGKYAQAVDKALKLAREVPGDGNVQQRAAEIVYLGGKPAESLPLFDRANELVPQDAAHNWQRGIALATAGKWSEGAAQFKLHHEVNPDDVENSAWYFLCVAKSQDAQVAKQSLIPSRGDARQPMMSILELFNGSKQPDEVLAAAINNTSEGPRRKSALFYADLYIGLYYDSMGNATEAQKFLRSSLTRGSAGYMVDTARVYLETRFPNPSNPNNPNSK